MNIIATATKTLAAQDAALAIARDYFHRNYDALCDAALALGGDSAVSRVAMIVEGLLHASELTFCLRRQLVEIHRMLCLDDICGSDVDETAFFSKFDILSEEVHNICQLTDSYRAMLEEVVRHGEDEVEVIIGRVFPMEAA